MNTSAFIMRMNNSREKELEAQRYTKHILWEIEEELQKILRGCSVNTDSVTIDFSGIVKDGYYSNKIIVLNNIERELKNKGFVVKYFITGEGIVGKSEDIDEIIVEW